MEVIDSLGNLCYCHPYLLAFRCKDTCFALPRTCAENTQDDTSDAWLGTETAQRISQSESDPRVPGHERARLEEAHSAAEHISPPAHLPYARIGAGGCYDRRSCGSFIGHFCCRKFSSGDKDEDMLKQFEGCSDALSARSRTRLFLRRQLLDSGLNVIVSSVV